MSAITVRNIPETTKQGLKQIAAQNGHSMEEEVRRILNRAVNMANRPKQMGLGTRLSLIIPRLNIPDGDPFELPPRPLRLREPIDFTKFDLESEPIP